jgi:hypothetical protein
MIDRLVDANASMVVNSNGMKTLSVDRHCSIVVKRTIRLPGAG